MIFCNWCELWGLYNSVVGVQKMRAWRGFGILGKLVLWGVEI